MSWKQFLHIPREARSNKLNMADQRKKKYEEGKTDLMLWLGFNTLLKLLIWDENMEMLLDDTTLNVSIFP